MISTADFNSLVKNAYVQWSNARNEFPSVRNQLAAVANVTDKTSEHTGMSGVNTARRRDEGDDAWKGTLKQEYTTTFTQAEIALQMDVTKQMRMFDKYDEIMKRMRTAGKGAERRMEMDVAAYLSYAWSSSYSNVDGETVATTTPDGNSLIDPTHDANGSSTTFSNELATTHDPISVDTLEALEELGNSFIDEADGRLVPVQFDTIICGRHAPTKHTIKRILGSEKLAETADNDKNTFSGSYKMLEVPFIDMNMSTEARDSDKARYVFLANLGDMDTKGLRLEQSQGVRFESPEQVFESSTWQFMTTALYDHGLTRAAWIVGTKGDSSSV